MFAVSHRVPPHSTPHHMHIYRCCWANTQIARSRACFRRDQRASQWPNHTPKCHKSTCPQSLPPPHHTHNMRTYLPPTPIDQTPTP